MFSLVISGISEPTRTPESPAVSCFAAIRPSVRVVSQNFRVRVRARIVSNLPGHLDNFPETLAACASRLSGFPSQSRNQHGQLIPINGACRHLIKSSHQGKATPCCACRRYRHYIRGKAR